MATNTQFNFTAYLEQPMPWQNEPASIRGIAITVTVCGTIIMCLFSLFPLTITVDCLSVRHLSTLHPLGSLAHAWMG